MNLKSSILKIAVVIALICMLVPVIAAEDVDSSAEAVSVDESTDVISVDTDTADDGADEDLDDEAVDDDEEVDDEADDEIEEDDDEEVDDVDGAAEDESADLVVNVITPQTKVKVGDLTNFGIVVYNKGPDTASNVIVRCALISGKVYVLDYSATQGTFDSYTGLWYVGDLEPGQYAVLSILGKVLSKADIVIVATVTSDTYDPDETNNVALGFIDVVSAAEDSAEEVSETLPATGNPIALAALALLSVAGISLRRRF